MIGVIKRNEMVMDFLQRDKYVNLNTLNYLDYNKDADVYVFDGDITNGVIVGHTDRNFFFLATESHDFLNQFWEIVPIGHKFFSGAPKPAADILRQGKVVVWQSPCKVYVCKSMPPIYGDSTRAVESLSVDDAEEVDKYYTYRSDDSVHEIRESIKTMDSACIRIDGQLASWCLVHAEDGSMGPLYTKEEYRGFGLAKTVSLRLMQKLFAKNLMPYVHIVEDNFSSLSLVTKLEGMEYSHDCVWFGMDKTI